MIWGTILQKLIGTLPTEVIAYYKEKRKLEHEKKLEIIRGKIAWEKAKTQRASESEGRDHDWELAQIKNSGFKDEWILGLLSIPLITVFIPATQQATLDGFIALESTPQWYQWLILVIFTAVYGIRIYRRKPQPLPETRYITVEEEKDDE